jgi:hypothetical protein
MPRTTRHHRVEVETTGPPTLDELTDLIHAAHRAGVPGHTVARIATVGGAGSSVAFVHDLAAEPRPSDAVTEILRTPVLRPSIGDLR